MQKFMCYCVVFTFLNFEFEDNILPSTSPQGLVFGGAIYRRVFCVTSLGGLYLEGLMHGEAYFQNFTVLGYYCYCVNPPKCVII